MNQIIEKIQRRVAAYLAMSQRKHIAENKNAQKARFEELAPRFEKHYSELLRADISPFTTPLWKDFNSKLEKAMLPAPPFLFLENRVIRDTMFLNAGGKAMEDEISFIEKSSVVSDLNSVLEEEYVGGAPLMHRGYRTSHNRVHHLYHLAKYKSTTGRSAADVDTVVEWGGGYGNMARLFKLLAPKPQTYIIVDTPLISCLQWLYLSSVLGQEEVNLISQPGGSPMPGKINLVPLGSLKPGQLKADLFLSTWALSESSKYSQDYVAGEKWFGAKHLLLAFQSGDSRLPHAELVGERAKDSGAAVEPIELFPGSSYAFL